jgi:hypothetical protein
MKERIDKLDFIKIKIFTFCKRYHQESEKTSHRQGGKKFAKDMSNKRLLSKLYKEFLKSISKKTNNWI